MELPHGLAVCRLQRFGVPMPAVLNDPFTARHNPCNQGLVTGEYEAVEDLVASPAFQGYMPVIQLQHIGAKTLRNGANLKAQRLRPAGKGGSPQRPAGCLFRKRKNCGQGVAGAFPCPHIP